MLHVVTPRYTHALHEACQCSALGNSSVGLMLDPDAGSEATFIADMAARRASGKIVALSLGGQHGAAMRPRWPTFFVSSLLTKYGLDDIDLDLEDGVPQGLPIITNLINGVKQLKQKIGERL
ncbi:hypothetical protein SPRG_17197 [Saprolegnia parasitica CBS 223.65]|uniref:GH18 domain-containing protein n=1 Tax=Saprolegnia parasitica (strain CBS 223.65) TaxID=695850 RepID=A0A067BG91_SAPPC|nr:hypothetical protein SPRG_17197 [Saprolegnia parasitica CBS 223.65]KDO17158.1 hypothetical protein SPRG_17197 [Saprolegnia parasitica CBS 223.65]|eukprot:XP_012212133.1 hypothetical protein SPRG_17197 [Saprolegnia parasitica CBS 223.65]